MKVYSTEEKELMMELGLKWAGTPNILVAVKAFGLKATAQVSSLCIIPLTDIHPEVMCPASLECFQVIDFQVFASPRITLKPLVPTFPCFANIFVSLMEKVCIFLSS